MVVYLIQTMNRHIGLMVFGMEETSKTECGTTDLLNQKMYLLDLEQKLIIRELQLGTVENGLVEVSSLS